MNRQSGSFRASYVGHTKNAKHLILDMKLATIEQLAYMGDEEVEALISEHFIAVVLQSDNQPEDITLIPKDVWGSLPTISRAAVKI